MSQTKSTPRILIIDDNRDIHQDFRKILRNESQDDELSELDELFGDSSSKSSYTQEIEIDSAYQGEEGYEKVQAALNEGRPYSLAFIDVRMPPGWDGIKTTQKIWEIDPEIQVVVCSAYSDYSWQEIIHQLQHTSRFLVLKKPFESIEVRQLVSTLHQRWYDARHDPLTGLLSRRAFMDHFHRQEIACNQEGESLSCVMIDLDFFKRVNDDYGHAAGDAVLQSVAKLLLQHSRPGDIVCRYGGEELCALLRNTSESAATEWADRVRELIATTEVANVSGTPVFVTSSFGICELDFESMTPEQAMENADIALRTAKERGRNRVITHSMITEGKVITGETKFFHLFDGILASDIMRPISSVNHDATLEEVAGNLANHSVSSVPVVNSDGKLIGQLSERDILQSFMVDEQEGIDAQQMMNSSVVCYPETTSLQEIYEFLVRVSIPQVVVARQGRPIGVVARSSLLDWLVSQGFAPAMDDSGNPVVLPVLNSNSDGTNLDLPTTTP